MAIRRRYEPARRRPAALAGIRRRRLSRRAVVGRVVALIVVGLALIAAVDLGRASSSSKRAGDAGTGELIAAPEGDYKVKPDQPGGMKVEGEGDTVFATSEGGGTGNRVDQPERGARSAGRGPDGRAGARRSAGTAQVVRRRCRRRAAQLTAQTPGAPPAAMRSRRRRRLAGPARLVPSEGAAQSAGRPSVEALRLRRGARQVGRAGRGRGQHRVPAARQRRQRGDGEQLCGKLKVAGEACFVPELRLTLRSRIGAAARAERAMKPVIFGLSGLALTADERAFFATPIRPAISCSSATSTTARRCVR